jgi:SAM-dependent methyltransferase
VDAEALAAVRAAYDALAPAYARQFLHELDRKPFDRALLAGFAELVRGRGRVADLGTGCGHVARFLADRSVDAFGVDLSPASVALARELHREVGLELREGDFFALDLPDRALAGVTAFYAYVHLDPADLVPAFREVARVLAPGAPFLVGFHLGDEKLHVDEWLGARVGIDWRFFPMPTVAGAIEAAGLAVEARVERAPYPDEHPTTRGYVMARRNG